MKIVASFIFILNAAYKMNQFATDTNIKMCPLKSIEFIIIQFVYPVKPA